MGASPRRLVAAIAAAVALLLPATAAAGTGSVDDGDDASGPLDVARVVHRDDAATVSWEVTGHGRFDDADVTTCLWSIEGEDRQVSVAWEPLAGSLVGLVRDGAGRGVAPAHVVRIGSEGMRVSVRRADIGNPDAYRYFLTCLSDGDGDGRILTSESDTVPGGSRLVTHDVSPAGTVDGVRRIAGADRVATAIALSKDGWRDGAAGAVVVASSDDFADALAGTPLAGARRAPLLLNPPDSLDPRVATEIGRVLPAGGRVYLLGGADALSDQVAAGLAGRGWSVRRIGGPDRFATSVAVAAELGHPATVLLADGLDFPDGLSAGAAGARLRGALLLTAGRTMPPAVAAELAAHRPAARHAVGGEAAAADPSAEPIVGADRYDTSRRVADRFFTQPTSVVVAGGVSFPDGLAAGARAATSGAPLVLSGPRGLSPTVFSWLQFEAGSIGAAGLAGGVRVLADDVLVGTLDAVN